MFDAVVFAGGGNRCYWQGGFYEVAAPRLGLTPKLVVAASAGAFAATYSLLGVGPEARRRVYDGCGPHLKNFDVAAWRRGEPLCPVGPLYNELLAQTIDDAALARLKAITDLRIAVTRMPRGVPPLAGAMLGIGAYQLEKHLLHPVHPRFGRALGFRAEFVSVRTLADARGMHDVLMASSGVPPFMPVTVVNGKPAFDGGLVDNVPVEPLAPIESAGGHTLVLLTRLYKNMPAVAGRTYVQPSRKIDLSQFDITNPDGIRAAYELGLRDGNAFAATLGKQAMRAQPSLRAKRSNPVLGSIELDCFVASAPRNDGEALFWPRLAATFHLPGQPFQPRNVSRPTHDEFSLFLLFVGGHRPRCRHRVGGQCRCLWR